MAPHPELRKFVAIITDAARRMKIAIISKTAGPDVTLINPFALTAKRSTLTAHAGMDTLTRAFEAYVANRAFADPSIATNPRRPTRPEIEPLYEQAL